MAEKHKTPKLLEFLFREAAEPVYQGASERLLAWSQAFEDWLAERLASSRSTHKQAVLTWRRLLQERRKMPWDLAPQDFEQHAAWMQAQGYAASTIAHGLGIAATFYRWCDERRVDPHCQPGFNPAAGVKRPEIRLYAGALLTQEEVRALLGILKQDPSPLGRREYAFFLARLRLGVQLRALQRLKWEQISLVVGKSSSHIVEQSGSCVVEEAWVEWRRGAGRQKLPEEVWQAIRAYLEASGRLAGMRAGCFIFAPLVVAARAGTQTQDWREQHCLSTDQLLANLKRYGRAAGIEENKLNLNALRRTAIRLRMEARDGEGQGVAGMKSFLDSQREAAVVKYRLGKLPELEEGQGQLPDETELAQRVPNRQAKVFQPGDGLKHGFYARSLPPEEIKAIRDQGLHGLEEEIDGLRTLEHELSHRLEQAADWAETTKLFEAISQAAARLGELVEAVKGARITTKEDKDQAELKADLAFALDCSEEEAEAAILNWGNEDEQDTEKQRLRLEEEIATLRYVIRQIFRRAMQTQETAELAHLVGIYGRTCIRLARLLKRKAPKRGWLIEKWKAIVDHVIDVMTREMGLVERFKGSGISDQGQGTGDQGQGKGDWVKFFNAWFGIEGEGDEDENEDPVFTWKPW